MPWSTQGGKAVKIKLPYFEGSLSIGPRSAPF